MFGRNKRKIVEMKKEIFHLDNVLKAKNRELKQVIREMNEQRSCERMKDVKIKEFMNSIQTFNRELDEWERVAIYSEKFRTEQNKNEPAPSFVLSFLKTLD